MILSCFYRGPSSNIKYLSGLKNSKSKLYKNFRKDRSIINYSKYCLVRSEYTIANQRAYNLYLNNIKNNFKTDPESFYKFVNSKLRAADFPSVVKLGSHESSDNTVINILFAKFLLLPIHHLHLTPIIKSL